MARSSHLSFANLTLRFGSKLVLLDLFDQVVSPAIRSETYERKHGVTAFFFRDVTLTDLPIEEQSERQLTLYGRLIKNTVLTRTQVYSRSDGLMADEASLDSAPSAFFALDLNNHKLMYLPETSGAPTLANFATTLQTFCKREHDNYIRALREASRNTSEPVSLRKLREEYPAPTVRVTPLASEGDVTAFIQSFSKLERAEFRLLSTNDERPQGDNFRRIREMKDDVGADTTTLVHQNKDGLNKIATTQEAIAAATGGNQKILLRGIADDGTVLRGNNDDLKLQVAISDPPDNLFERAKLAVGAYFAQLRSGRLRPDTGSSSEEKLSRVRERLNDVNGTS